MISIKIIVERRGVVVLSAKLRFNIKNILTGEEKSSGTKKYKRKSTIKNGRF
jgi:hypothetical protein